MPFIKSIASRIFGLAVVLVCLMVALAGFLLWQVTALDDELQHIAGYYGPLNESLGELNESGLRRRIAFERWCAALESQADRQAHALAAGDDYEKFTAKMRDELGPAQALLAAPPRGLRAEVEVHDIRSTLDECAQTFRIITERQREIIQLLQQGQSVRAADMITVLDDLQNLLHKEFSDTQNIMAEVLGRASRDAAHRHAAILWTTIGATFTSVLLGLLVAAIVTQRLVHPVRSLMSGLRTAQEGDFSIELPVNSADEIGALTQSFNFFIGEMRSKEELRRTFGKYIDPRILEHLMGDPASAEAAGGRQQMVVSFADLVGFTEIGEHLTPAGVVNLLNRHFTLQAEAVQQQHGVVDKFMGDAVMAFWGPPFTQNDEHPLLACRGALAQARAIRTLQAQLPEITGLRKNLPVLDIRIGLSAGEVIVGNIGSENTRSYTVIGDTVNLASRLEQANRFYGTRILICAATRAAAGPAIVAREIDTIVVKGKTETTGIYELLGLPGDVSAETLGLCEHSAAALAAYRVQDWDAAEQAFRECLAFDSADRPAQLFLERIAAFRLHPPAPDWNGAWIYDAK